MSGYNVVRNSGGEGLPDVLDAVFDGELELSDSRVAAALKADPSAARRFRETQRVVDRLARRPLTPDLSASILAAVHSQKPFAAAPGKSRSRLSPARLAFAGGLLAGVVLVVALQSIARTPHTDIRSHTAETRVAMLPGEVINPVQPAAIVSERFEPDSQPVKPLRRPLGMGKSSKYEAIVGSGPANSGVVVAGFAGDVGLDGESRESVQLASSTLVSTLADPCAAPYPDLPYAGVVPAQSAPASMSGALLAPTQTNAAYEPSAEWPPADINAFIDHISECGVSDDLRTMSLAR